MLSFSRRNWLRWASVITAAAPLARAAESPRRPISVPEVWSRTELYFGTNRSNGQPVTDTEFDGFLERQVTSRFPDGLTLLNGYGQFRNSRGDLIREKSFVLILFYPPQMQDAHKRIQEIRDQYRAEFNQESVLRSDAFSFISF